MVDFNPKIRLSQTPGSPNSITWTNAGYDTPDLISPAFNDEIFLGGDCSSSFDLQPLHDVACYKARTLIAELEEQGHINEGSRLEVAVLDSIQNQIKALGQNPENLNRSSMFTISTSVVKKDGQLYFQVASTD